MEEEIASRPKWLLELENRKRKPRLAHEAGAGAPCMNCNSACPGLDLHFWRKICKNCKCGRDDHDVEDDEFPQFDLLFGPSGKLKKKSTHLLINNKKQNESETTFEWVPPDTTKELAMDYMKALPEEKLPIKGSTGAALRRQLLQKQLPLHDIDHKVCDELSEQEQKQFQKYLENIKKYVGQGKVIKMLAARPFDRSFMTPVNATDMQRCSPQHKPYTPSSGVQLRTPSSFTVKSPYTRLPYETQIKQAVMTTNNNEISNAGYNCSLDNIFANSDIARSQAIEGKFFDNHQHANDIASINERSINSKIMDSIPMHFAEQETLAREMQTSENYVPHRGSVPVRLEAHKETMNSITPCVTHSEIVNNEAASIAESMLADALLPPSAIHANDIIGSTLDERELMFIRDKLNDKYNAIENSGAHIASKSCQALDASDMLHPCTGGVNNPTRIKDMDKAAIIVATKSPAGNLRERLEDNISSPLEAEKRTYKPLSHVIQSVVTPANMNEQYGQLLNHKTANNEPSATSKVMMEGISDLLSNKYKPVPIAPPSDVVLQAGSQHSSNVTPLQSKLSSSVVQPTIIHSEQLQTQVFPHNIIGALNENLAQGAQHMEQLASNMESLKMDSTKIQKCQKCNEDIRVGDVAVIVEKANNASWHPGCFICSVCNELLADLVYFHYKNKLYCLRDLAAFLGIPRCFACDELIFVREYTVAEGHNYHVKHFCCWDCDMPLAGQQYITENDRPLCLLCYQKTYAKTCAACNIVIAADQQGVAIKNLDFHATEICFRCHSCKKNLLNGRMAIKKDKLFCSKECIAKFLDG